MEESIGHIGKPEKCLIKRTRNGREHINNCSEGYRLGLGLWQAHHILPVSALNSDKHISASPENLEYIVSCLCITDWNVNAEPNVIGLDNKVPYMFDKIYPLPRNLPSHLIDHDHYTKESYDYMEANVWDSLKDAREVHKLDPKSIESQLNDATTYFKGEVEARGKRNNGTIWCWDHRFDTGMEEKWYVPFSMSDNPRKRHPGAKFVLQWLTNIFNVIK